jgi:hypothetical protein
VTIQTVLIWTLKLKGEGNKETDVVSHTTIKTKGDLFCHMAIQTIRKIILFIFGNMAINKSGNMTSFAYMVMKTIRKMMIFISGHVPI